MNETNMPVDLHLHTTASDGSMGSTQIVELASRLGIKVIAISDHDTIDGIAEALDAGLKYGIVIIPAIELSSQYNSRDMHILGYFIDFKSKELRDSLKCLKAARLERAKKMVACLQQHGVKISMDDVIKTAGQASVGRPHIARLLLAKSYVSSFSDAFDKYLKRNAPCFFEKLIYSPEQAISIIHKAGGIAVFAHPGLAKLDDYIPEFVKMGLDGIETYHSEHTAEMTEHYIKTANTYNLLVTGGSDCHGASSTHGLKMGTVYVPDKIVDDLVRRYK